MSCASATKCIAPVRYATSREGIREMIAEVYKIYRRREIREANEQAFLNDEFKGMMIKQLTWLMKSAPYEHRDRDELWAWLNFYFAEALQQYDPDYRPNGKTAKFSSFFMNHLRLRSPALQQHLWVRSSGNEHCRMLHIRDKRRSPGNGGHRESALVHDPDAEDLEAGTFLVQSEAEPSARVNEFLASLPPDVREDLDKALAYHDQDELAAAFGSKHFRSKVAKLLGISKDRVARLRSVVQGQLPEYLEAA